jgi:hypothetical protein
MAKPPKTPRPQKPPILPARADHVINPTIGLIQEKLIGRAVVEWAKLEACMGDAIQKMLGLDFEYGRIVTGRLDATNLIRMLREVGNLYFEEADFHSLSTICDKIDMRREDRNLIVHGTWGRSDDNTAPMALSLRIKGDPSEIVSETFPGERMKAIIADTLSLKWELIRLVKLDVLPSKPPEQPPST